MRGGRCGASQVTVTWGAMWCIASNSDNGSAYQSSTDVRGRCWPVRARPHVGFPSCPQASGCSGFTLGGSSREEPLNGSNDLTYYTLRLYNNKVLPGSTTATSLYILNSTCFSTVLYIAFLVASYAYDPIAQLRPLHG